MLWVNRIFHLLYGMVSNLRGKSFFFGMCYAVLGEVEILLIYVIWKFLVLFSVRDNKNVPL